tara:strand:- start:531 stop:1814 length:1284 start_codon:yes stop_codon:yes gene_type:complete
MNRKPTAREYSISRKGLQKLVLPYAVIDSIVKPHWQHISYWIRIFNFVFGDDEKIAIDRQQKKYREEFRYLCRLWRDAIPPPRPYMLVPEQFPTPLAALEKIQELLTPNATWARANETRQYHLVETISENEKDGTFDIQFAHTISIDSTLGPNDGGSIKELTNLPRSCIKFPAQNAKTSTRIVIPEEIRISSGIYDGDLMVGNGNGIQNLRLQGNGIQETTIRGYITVKGSDAKNIVLDSITIDGSRDKETAYWDPAGNSNACIGIELGAKCQIIDSEIINAGGAGCGVVHSGSKMIMKRCIVHDSKRGGIVGCEHSVMELSNCKSYNNSYHGLDVNTASTAKMQNCIFSNNSQYGIVVWGKGSLIKLENECVVKDNGESDYHTLDSGTIEVVDIGGIVSELKVEKNIKPAVDPFSIMSTYLRGQEE